MSVTLGDEIMPDDDQRAWAVEQTRSKANEEGFYYNHHVHPDPSPAPTPSKQTRTDNLTSCTRTFSAPTSKHREKKE